MLRKEANPRSVAWFNCLVLRDLKKVLQNAAARPELFFENCTEERKVKHHRVEKLWIRKKRKLRVIVRSEERKAIQVRASGVY